MTNVAGGERVDWVADVLGEDLRWCRLRPARDDEDDEDVLVAAADLDAVTTRLRAAGMVEEPALGRGSHRFFRGLRQGRFVALDLVTRVDVGPSGCVVLPVDDLVLERGRGRLPAPVDEAWLTVLHLLLDDDKDPRDPTRRARLRELGQEWLHDEHWERTLGRAVPELGGAPEVVAALADDAAALSLRDRTRQALRRRHRRFLVRHRVLRLLEPAMQWRGRRGLLVAVMGVDGAGKSTLLAELSRGWPWPVARIYFGLWPDARGASGLLWPLRRPFRALLRHLRGRVASARGQLVLFDRYSYDAAVPPRGALQGLKRIYFLVLRHSCPPPDLVLYLDLPADVAFARKGEMDVPTLTGARTAVLEHLARRADRGGLVVRCLDATRPAEEVARSARGDVWELAAARLGGTGPEAL